MNFQITLKSLPEPEMPKYFLARKLCTQKQATNHQATLCPENHQCEVVGPFPVSCRCEGCCREEPAGASCWANGAGGTPSPQPIMVPLKHLCVRLASWIQASQPSGQIGISSVWPKNASAVEHSALHTLGVPHIRPCHNQLLLQPGHRL